MKITKLPNVIDPNIMIREEIERRNSICPFCNETEEYDLFKYKIVNNHIHIGKGIEKQPCYESWYGNKYEYKHPFLGLFAFWEPDLHWRVDHYICHTCGAEWKSDPYPKIDVKV